MNKDKGIKRLKILASVVTATCIMGSFNGCAKKSAKKDETEPNRIGYSTVIQQLTADDDNFAILDVGDHDKKEKKTLIKILNSKDVSLGIVISTDAVDECDIYNDLAYAKSLIAENTIDFPVYLNLAGIIENENLNPEMKRKVASIFLDNCAKNGMYVGIYGTDEILCKAKEQLGDIIKPYDALVVTDDGNIKYSGKHTLYQTTDGTIHSAEDLSEVIKAKKLNNASQLLSDKEYTIKEGDSITDIAFRCGMSAKDLLKYNKLNKRNIKSNTKIKIPSVQEKVSELNTIDGFIRGCDISAWQEHIDWNELKKNFGFVIIKIAFGPNVADKYEENIANAQKNGIPTGVYCFNGCSAKDRPNLEGFKEYQKKQAAKTLELLKGKNITYPVYLDVEKRPNESRSGWGALLPENYVISMINIWHEAMSSNGYMPGLYANQDCYRYMRSIYNKIDSKTQRTSEEDKFVANWRTTQKWLAGGKQYGTGKPYGLNNVLEPDEDFVRQYSEVNMYQVTDSAINAGAGTWEGHLDINFCNVDYQKQKPVESGNNVEMYEIADDSNEYINRTIFGFPGAVGTSITTGAVATKSKCKKKSRGSRN